MACIRTISHRTRGDSPSARAIVHTSIAPEMEREGEASSPRIHLPYRDVHKFHYDGSNTGKIPKMLWKMLRELGNEKQPKYFRTQVTYEGSESVWHVQVFIFTPEGPEKATRGGGVNGSQSKFLIGTWPISRN
jgi:hypothetical protein